MCSETQLETDLEAAVDNEYLEGYVDFSQFIASDKSFSIYRGFHSLAARNLQYLQAELQLTEKELEIIDKEDMKIIKHSRNDAEKENADHACRAWEDFLAQVMDGDQRQIKKFKLIYKLRTQTKVYEEALLRRRKILLLEKPEEVPFKAFKDFFWTKKPILGSGYDLLDNEEDMIALGNPKNSDPMSSVIHRFLGYRLRVERKTPKSWGKMYYYPNERVSMIVAVLGILVSAALLVGAILALYFVKPMGTRVGIVGVFTVIFAASVMLLTSARQVEVYGATAAYAAVLVVFISTNN